MIAVAARLRAAWPHPFVELMHINCVFILPPKSEISLKVVIVEDPAQTYIAITLPVSHSCQSFVISEMEAVSWKCLDNVIVDISLECLSRFQKMMMPWK